MSINQKTGQGRSLIEGNSALQLFTDRHEFTHLFAEYLHDDLPCEKILYFHGDGGNGKSLLLKFLQEKCCKRLPSATWQQLKTKSDAEVAAYIELETWDYTPVPMVLHDFGQQPIGNDRPQDPFYGLLMLRRNLANVAAELNYRLRFPLYDFACVWYLYKMGKKPEEVKELLPVAELDLISAIVDMVSQKSC